MVQLCLQHLVRSPGVGFGSMRILQVLVAVELVGCREGTLFQFVVNHLHVDKLSLCQVDVDARSQEFLHQHRHVETVGVEAGDVRSLDIPCDVLGHLLERRTVGHILVVDAMNGCRSLRNMHFRIDAQRLALLVAVRIHLQVTDFHDPVSIYIGSGSLQIEKHYRIL